MINVDGLTCYEGLSRGAMAEQYGDEEEEGDESDEGDDDGDRGGTGTHASSNYYG